MRVLLIEGDGRENTGAPSVSAFGRSTSPRLAAARGGGNGVWVSPDVGGPNSRPLEGEETRAYLAQSRLAG